MFMLQTSCSSPENSLTPVNSEEKETLTPQQHRVLYLIQAFANHFDSADVWKSCNAAVRGVLAVFTPARPRCS